MAGRAEGLKTQGEGKKEILTRDQFPPDQQARYDIFAVKCIKCHEMARPIAALKTGITPVSHGPFDADDIKKYVVKMMRKPNSGIEKDDARELIQFLIYAREVAAKGKP